MVPHVQGCNVGRRSQILMLCLGKNQNTVVILIFQNFKGNKNWFLTELRETTFGLSYQEV